MREPRSIPILAPAALVLAGVLALWLSFGSLYAPYIGNDGYQYLDVVANVEAGRCICTNLAHFDEQVAPGRFPVPFTHFPPGYPLLTAAIAALGVPPDTAGYLISAVGFLLTIWLIWDIGIQLGAHPALTALFCLLWIINEDALTYAATVGTDAIFTAVFLAIAALIVRDLRSSGSKPGFLPAIGALAGLSYWLRYAGLFVLPVAVMYILWRWLIWPGPRSRKTFAWAALGLAAEAALTFSIQIRNTIYTGSWRGGFTSGPTHGWREIPVPAVKAAYHIVFGDRVITKPDLWSALFLVALLAATWFSWQGWRSQERTDSRACLRLALIWIGILAAAYTGGLILAALTSVANAFSRYFVPLFPLVLAGLAGIASPGAWRKQGLAIAGMAIAVFALQRPNLSIRPVPPAHLLTVESLSQEVQPGVSALAWLRQRVPPSGVLVAVDGQAVHYLLQRPVLSLIEPDSTDRASDPETFRSLMTRFGATYLLVFPSSSSPYLDSQNDIPFLKNLAAGDAPEWLSLAARAPNVAVFECASCAR
jgi:Dolichyl-phosphate-mannose-protein mannosyltransferase